MNTLTKEEYAYIFGYVQKCIVVDRDGKVVYYDDEVRRLLGYENGELLSKSIDTLMNVDWLEQSWRQKTSMDNKDGRPVHLRVTTRSMKVLKHPYYLLFINENLGENHVGVHTSYSSCDQYFDQFVLPTPVVQKQPIGKAQRSSQ